MIDDTTIDDVVRRLARKTPSGGHVIERAAVLAEGSHFSDIEAWILKSGGLPEAPAETPSDTGISMHSGRSSRIRDEVVPVRYLLPPGALPAAGARQQ